MSSPKSISVIFVAFLLFCISQPPSFGTEDDSYTWGARPEGSTISIDGKWSRPSSGGNHQGGSGSQPPSQNAGNSSDSSNNQIVPAGPVCPDGTVGLLLGCESGLSIAGVLGGSPTIAAAAPESTGGEPVVDPSTLVTISDVQSIVADGGTISVSPNRGWVYVNKPVYFESDAVGYDEDLSVLGNAVTVHLTPVSYTWDPGDGSEVFSSDNPGGPWPDGTVTHAYLKDIAEVRIGLTVEWSAAFTVGGTTYPVDGTATSTTQSDSFDVREAEAVLTR
ncbi:hypothetical protein [Ancrocorticia populi]|uniref:hypothetical protein n=1 Tax=Ancrocorticia populi TaxID=2175228 RepID=UPI002356C980|nr:hypothetical protein [Ancrocorticia populi]